MKKVQGGQDPGAVDRHLQRVFAWPLAAGGEVTDRAWAASRSRRKVGLRHLVAAAALALIIIAVSVIAVSQKARTHELTGIVWSEGGLTVVVTSAGTATISDGRGCAGSKARRMLVAVD